MKERKSKSIFTSDEFKRIIALVAEKEKANSSKQKGIRDKIRRIGLYWREIAPGMEYTVENVKRLFENGTLRISDGEKKENKPVVSSSVLVVSPIVEDPLTVKPDDSVNFSNQNEISEYKSEGFDGFIPVRILRESKSIIPDMKGIYVVLRTSEDAPVFLEKGSAKVLEDKDPNVAEEVLAAKYVSGSQTVYIGKATNLRNRLGQLLRFGDGRCINHWGGRYLWQLADAEDLLIAWKVITSENPREVESRMLNDFKNRYGKLPFANISN